MNPFIDEVFIEANYSRDKHSFEFDIRRLNKTYINKIGGELPYSYEYQRLLILTKQSTVRVHLRINTVDLACSDPYFEIRRVYDSSNKITFTFESIDVTDYHFHSNLFNVIETISSNLSEIIERLFGTIVLIAVSDVHGDIPLYLIPFYISRQISKLEYREEIGIISFYTNHVKNCQVVLNGDLLPPNLVNGCSEFRRLFSKKILPIFTQLINKFISISLLSFEKYGIRFVFVIGNHDGPIFNIERELFEEDGTSITSSSLLSKVYMRYFFGDMYMGEARVVSFMHGIYDMHVETEFVSVENGVRIANPNYYGKLRPDLFSRSNFDRESHHRLEIETINHIIESKSEIIDSSKSLLYISVLGHSADYDLITDDKAFDKSNKKTTTPRRYRLRVLLDRFDKVELTSSILENVICIDSEYNSSINVMIRQLREVICYRDLLYKFRELISFNIPFVEKGITI